MTTSTQPDDLEAEVRGLLAPYYQFNGYMSSHGLLGRYAEVGLEAIANVVAALRKEREHIAALEAENEVYGKSHNEVVALRMELDDARLRQHDAESRVRGLEGEQRQFHLQLAEAKAERDQAKSDHGNLYLRYVNVVECDLRMACADRDSANQRLAHLEAALAKVREYIDGNTRPEQSALKTLAHVRAKITEALAATGGKPE